ncbi:MAG: VWA domain-containing protein [Phycisphaerales bacterium]|nr:VWA domain-containing protein [Phycisphaerales bacterium]
MTCLALIISFDRPWWWVVLIPVVALILWIGRKTLSGLSSRTRKVALGIRLFCVALIIGTLAEPQFRRTNTQMAVTVVLDASKSQPREVNSKFADSFKKWEEQNRNDPDNLLGVVTAARVASVQIIPRRLDGFDIKDVGPTDATDLASGLRRAMAVMPPNAANRIVIVSDGNETMGDLMDAARSAEAARIPVDVLPIRYAIDREVIVDKLIAPSTARPGEVAVLKAVIVSTKPAKGKLSILMNGQPVDLDQASDDLAAKVELVAGTNVQAVPIRLPANGPVKFEAIFEPLPDADGKSPDTLTENNRALAVTFIGGQGRVLVLTSRPDEAKELVRAIEAGSRTITVKEPYEAWSSLAELGSYECVALVNVSASEVSQSQQEDLKTYVHDLGGGMVMVGGDQSFGAGGWIGSTVADILPIKLDPPQKRQMPRGALGLVMHSCEMPNGNFWGRRCAEAAIDALQAQDLVGVIEYNWQDPAGGWVFPLQVVGDKSAPKRALGGLTYGDAPDFQSMLQAMYKSLTAVPAGQKHVIIISDGDPQPPTDALLAQYVAAKISISTVAVFPHSPFKGAADLSKMKRIADRTNGTYHEITDTTGNLRSIPEIFIKEAQTVKRSLIWEGDPLIPQITTITEGLRGISLLPAVTGYVVAADREGLSQVSVRGAQNDPILAQWQHGLGRVVTFTSDATGKWASRWMGWDQYRQFWDQHIKWAMRPASDQNIRIVTVDEGEKTRVIVEAVDEKGERMNFLNWRARAVSPDGVATSFDLVQTGPGRYESTVDTSKAGSHTISMGYDGGGEGPGAIRGAVQAAITRPFADEYRSLRDNAALLEQVAKRTGGRVLAFTPEAKDLWDRKAMTMPVSLRPIWVGALILMLGVWLVDVAVRRVRIDIPLIARSVAGLFGKAKEQAGEQIDALKVAREKARERMAKQAEAGGGRVGQSIGLDGSEHGEASSAKFEATAEEIAYLRKSNRSMEEFTGPGAPIESRGAPAEGPSVEQAKQDAEAGLSRLMRAKKRAQDDIDQS